ncbi:MAG: ribonuclease III [Bacteroidota bacterium]
MRRVLRVLRRFFPLSRSSNSGKGAEPILQPEVLHRLESLLEYPIGDPALFAEALVHRSYLQKLPPGARSNERLEFLGDAVLSLIVAEYLHGRFPQAEEGDLTKTRSRLVNRKALAAYGKALHLSDFILLSTSAAQSVDKGGDTILADAVEALIAAVYLDAGFQAARLFVLKLVRNALQQRTIVITDDNYKSLLLEHAQSHGLSVPRYVTVREEGPDHERVFTVEVLLGDTRYGKGTGKNKKNAEQAAASEALQRLMTAPGRINKPD